MNSTKLNSINDIKNDKINSSLIKVQALQKEYDVTLQQYQEAGQNYISSLQSNDNNPCNMYQKDSTGISKECYEKIWADQGCNNTESINTPEPDTEWYKPWTLDNLVKYFYSIATNTYINHNICYTNSDEQTTNTAPVYPNNSVFSALKGRAWWGTQGLSEGTVNTQEECENMCANSTECSGATFNPVKRYCWTRTGDLGLSPGIDSDYALITQQKASLSIMKYLNQRLLDINNQITDEVNNINPQVTQLYDEKNKKQKELNLYYTKLLQQKIELDKQLQEYYSIEEEENNQSITINQENISFRFWVLIACLVVLITIQRIVGAKFNPLPQIIWFFIFILLTILSFTLSTPAGFLVWGVLLVWIILMKTGYLPSP